MVPPVAAQAADAVAAAPAQVPAEDALKTLEAWLGSEVSSREVRKNAAEMLDVLRGGIPLPEGAPVSGWDAYFAAIGKPASSRERQDLARFQALNPHLSREVEALALDVARAHLLRDRAFSALAPEQWDLLPEAVARLTAGEELPPAHAEVLAAVDLRPLVDGAAILARSADAAPQRLREAAARDAELDAALPRELRDPRRLDDPALILREAAGGVAPVVTDLTLEEALRGLALLGGPPTQGFAASRLLPDDLRAPLAALVVAHTRELAGASPDAGLATLATISEQLPRLTRAAYNLTVTSAGSTLTPMGQRRPLEELSISGPVAPLQVIHDLYGPKAVAAPPAATFSQGFVRFSEATGAPVTPEAMAQARAVESAMGPAFSAALGSVLAAQADYVRVHDTPADLAELRARAGEVLDSDAPLTLDDLETLQAAADAERAYDLVLGRATFALAYSILAASESEPQPMSGHSQDALFDQNGVLILNDASTVVDPADFPGRRALIVDLGGNDVYRIPVARAERVGVGFGVDDLGVSVAIDLGGNDRYESSEDLGVAAARGGPFATPFAMLLDVDGKDTYQGVRGGGYGIDGVAVLVDLNGVDSYSFGGDSIAFARTTSQQGVAAGVLMDGTGNDRYVAGGPIARIGADSVAFSTIGLFLDAVGADRYEPTCEANLREPCYGVPRPENASNALGAVVFIDLSGDNTYMRGENRRDEDPVTTGERAWDYPQEQRRQLDNIRYEEFSFICTCYPNVTDVDIIQPQVSAERFVHVYDGRGFANATTAIYDFLAKDVWSLIFSSGSPAPGSPDWYGFYRDDDGDLIPGRLETLLDMPADRPLTFGPQDTDNDGFLDLLEDVLGTRSDDASSKPVGVPRPPEGAPDPGVAPAPENFILNVPRILGVGGPGTTRYTEYYQFTLDVGMGEQDGDQYTTAVALNGHAIDLGGADSYRPLEREGFPAHIAHVDGGAYGRWFVGNSSYRPTEVASLVDLGGKDLYVAERQSFAYAAGDPGSVAILIDAGGADTYRAPLGASHAWSESGGVAWFFDLRGADTYVSPTQGIAAVGPVRVGGATVGVYGRAALFVDGGGADTYDTTSDTSTPAQRDRRHGWTSGAVSPESPVAAFLDLGGDDRYLYLDADTLQRLDVAQMEDRLRIDGRTAVFFDATVFGEEGVPEQPGGADGPRDSDDDGDSDLVEIVGETDSHDGADSLTGEGYLLHLPRAGLVVGDSGANTYRASRDYALQIDVGGDDLYNNRAGASVPGKAPGQTGYPVALLVDVDGDDRYLYNGSTGMNYFTLASETNTVTNTSAASGARASLVDMYGVAQGAGLLGVGVLRDGAGRDTFSARAESYPSCPTCSVTVRTLAQGAGLLGVGVLALGHAPAAAPDASADTLTATANAFSERGEPRAHTWSQGAGILGVGLLVSEGVGPDKYRLASTHRTDGAVGYNHTSGQGYGLMGAGILIDSGGDNSFVASTLAQGVADTLHVERAPIYYPFPPIAPYVPDVGSHDPDRTLGALLLTGHGADSLTAVANSQAYAAGLGAFALLLDVEGDDSRTLESAPGRPFAGLGQAAAFRSGRALLLDDRGNDRYVLRGEYGQGFASQAQAQLVDLAGADTYDAWSFAQGVVSSMDPLVPLTVTGSAITRPAFRTTPPAFGFLVDRMGNDIYKVLDGSRAQGAAHFNYTVNRTDVGPSTNNGVERHVGLALFVDAGGYDYYAGKPLNQTPLRRDGELSRTRTDTGNDWAWESSPNRTATAGAEYANAVNYHGFGFDNASLPGTLATAFEELYKVVRLHELKVPDDCRLRSCNGTIALETFLGTEATPIGGFQTDRVEFFDNAFFIGNGTPSGAAPGQKYRISFDSRRLDEAGVPIHEDGRRTLSALIYPRVGTPDAPGGISNPTYENVANNTLGGRRAAVEVEPFRTTRPIFLDNPPVGRSADVGGAPLVVTRSNETGNHTETVTALSTAQGNVTIRLRVDRDLERCAATCPAFSTNHLGAGDDEWSLPPMSFGGKTYLDASCTLCAPGQVAAFPGGGKAFLTWSPVKSPAVRGYLVEREAADGSRTPAGFVDARLQPRAWNLGEDKVHWFRDAAPGDAKAYHVLTVHALSNGTLVHTGKRVPFTADASVPEPARGVRVLGLEGRAILRWLPGEGATHYRVTRHYADVTETVAASVAGTEVIDPAPVADRDYTYRVVALKDGVAALAPNLPAVGKASPGHDARLLLQTGVAPETAVANLLVAAPLGHASFGGSQTHRIGWDAKSVADGTYWLNTTFVDGGGKLNWRLSKILLDGNAPVVTVTLASSAGGPNLVAGGIRIPFTVEESAEGSGLRRTAFWVKVDDEPWPEQPMILPPTARELVYAGARDGARLQIIAVGEDNVSNVQHVAPGPRGWTPELRDGFAAALAANAYTTHRLDISPPSVKADERLFVVRPGQTIEFTVDAADAGTGLKSYVADLRGERFPLTSAGGGRLHGRWTANGADGLLQILVIVTDNAGNEARVSAGSVTLDGTPPQVNEALVLFPGGRVVGRPGETATLRVRAEDRFTAEGEINMTLETGNVSSAGRTYLRYDAEARVYTATFPVNRMVGKQANVSLRSMDLAGNAVERILTVQLNSSAAALTVPAVEVGPDAAILTWRTQDAVRGRVDFGLSPQLGRASDLTAPGHEHRVVLTELMPDTEYYAFAVAVTDAGIETRSDLVTFRTAPSFNVTVAPVLGIPYSRGETQVKVDLRRHDNAEPRAQIEAYLLAPRGSPRLVGSAVDAGASTVLTLDLSSVRDGDYALVVRARQDEFKGESATHVLHVDRMAPLLSQPDELAVAKGATYTLRVEERGSGIDVSKVHWSFGGRRCAAALSNDVLACVVPDLGSDATATMRLVLPDRAGNVVTLEADLPVDSAAPVVAGHSLGAADGSPHLRPGAKARLSVDVKDLSVKLVEADLTHFGLSKAVALDRVPGTDRHEVLFDVPGKLAEGPVSILVRAVDAAGHATAIAVSSAVDATPPALVSGSLVPQSPGEIMVSLQVDEPARVAVKAPGALGELRVAGEGASATHVLFLKGLRPGAAVRALVTLTDRAGQETTLVLDGAALTDENPPGKVPSLRVEDRGDGRVLLRWDAASDDDAVAHYRIIRTLERAAPVTLPPVSGLIATDDIPVGVPARYTVAAVDHAGNPGEISEGRIVSVAVPRLANGTVDPPAGGPGLFTFSVELTDGSGSAPQVVVRVDGVAHPMTPDKDDCRAGCRYTAVVLVGAETLSGGPHEYSYEVVSGAFKVAYPELDPLRGPTVLAGEAPPLGGVLAAANRVPAGGFVVAALAAAAALAAVLVLRRRKA